MRWKRRSIRWAMQVVEHADAPTDVIAVLVSTAVSADELDVVLARMEQVPGVLHATWEVSTRD